MLMKVSNKRKFFNLTCCSGISNKVFVISKLGLQLVRLTTIVCETPPRTSQVRIVERWKAVEENLMKTFQGLTFVQLTFITSSKED